MLNDMYLGRGVQPGALSPGTNYQTTDIAFGALVSRDIQQTDPDVMTQIMKRANGVILPNRTNVRHVRGVVQTGSRGPLKAGTDGLIQSAGVCRALVYVPPSTVLASIPTGTGLVMASEWDEVPTPDETKLGRYIGTTWNYGVLEACYHVMDTAAAPVNTVIAPPHPRAILLEDLTPAAAARVQLAWVELLPHAGPLPLCVHITSQTPTDNTLFVLPLDQAAVITSVRAQLLIGGTSANTTVDVQYIFPKAGGGVATSVFQTSKSILIPNDMTDADAPIYGGGYKKDGNLTTPGWGTNARHGLLVAAEASRVMAARTVLMAVIDAADANVRDLSISVQGHWL